LAFSSKGRYCSEDEVINKLASELFLTCDFRENSILKNIAVISIY